MWPVLIVFGLIFIIYWGFSKPQNFPPGPPRLPIIGSFPYVNFKKQPLFHRALEETGEKWGCKDGIMGLYFGGKPAIAVWNPKLVREVLQRDEFQGRPDAFLFRLRSLGKQRGIVFGDGPCWSEQRRFTLCHLRDLGILGLHKVQHHVQEEITLLIERIMNHPEGPFPESRIVPANGLFAVHVINILWALVSGKRYSHDDHELHKLLRLLTSLSRSGQTPGSILNAMPWIRFILPGFLQFADFVKTFKEFQNFVKVTIEEHKATFDKDHINDFIDAYLLEIREHSSEKEAFFNEEELIAICMDLFNAGSGSVGSTLSFALLYLGHYPKVQARLWKELKTKLGVGCSPCLEDRSRLSYLQAVLEEVMRINPVAPMAPPHRATQEAKLGGYTIPKNSGLYLNLWAVSHDPSKWKEPSEFQPERFIDENGFFVRDEVSLYFGFGKRQCIGMPFARSTLFLFLGALVANFEFQLVPGEPPPSTLSLPGFSTCPQPFNILAIKR